MTADIDHNKLDALETQVDELVEQITAAMHAQAYEAVLECEAEVDALLTAIDALLGDFSPPTLH
jgi:hypothetical protein